MVESSRTNWPKRILFTDNGKEYILNEAHDDWALYELDDPNMTIDDLRSFPDTSVEVTREELEIEDPFEVVDQ